MFMSLRFLRRLKCSNIRIFALQTRSISSEIDDLSSASSDEEGASAPCKSGQKDEGKEDVKISKEPFIPSPDVPGLSSNVYQISEGQSFPGISKEGTYKNPEYFSYHCTSFYDAQVELMTYRLPQPSSIDTPKKCPPPIYEEDC
ncbi:uncharacterized protein LOC124364936 [Homalodisca vitripennis]|uniref:uncharacterized protein LOC124364936 n=1 Tax=Homalodisca vitripennis TaxID=197043 RepID=UPI001EEAF103|nr:uncharacterized protein LOC124364936 [Homalodisca vitripennis]KAG8328978.1 hypothetical protein J6590_097617 [Homalodisca vitripennis]